MAVKHSFASAKSDGGDATLVKPSDWNASHTIDTVTRSIWLAGFIARVDTGSAASGLGTNPDAVPVLTLADAATSGGVWTFAVPHDWASGVLTAQPIWAPGSTDAVAHTVRWSLDVKALAAAADVTAAGTTTNFTGTSAARTANLVVKDTATSTGVTPAAVGDLIRLNLRRIGADGADTYVGVVNLLGVLITYTANPVA